MSVNAGKFESISDTTSICYRYNSSYSGAVKDKGTTLQLDLDSGTFEATFNGITNKVNALQFHFHAPSEHTFDGKHYDLELHLVHWNYDEDRILEVCIFFDVE